MAEKQPVKGRTSSEVQASVEDIMNGFWWRIIFKFALITHPILVTAILTWGTWMTVETQANTYYRESGAKFTLEDGRALEERVDGRLAAHVDHPHPNMVTRQELIEVVRRLERIEDKLDRIIGPPRPTPAP